MMDPFLAAPQTAHDTSAGLVDLPILYHDATNVVALFSADQSGAERLLADTGLRPALTLRGRALVALSFYEYRHTSVGPYDEVGTAIFAVRDDEPAPLLGPLDLYRPPRRRRLGVWVVDLPVTTGMANAAGREIWGYPKFVTRIDFLRSGPRFSCAVAAPEGGSALCALEGTMGRGVAAPPLSVMTYSALRGALIRTTIDVRGPTRAHAPGSLRLDVGPSRHRMAENLRALGLERATPKLVLVNDRFRAKLHAGERVR